MDGYSVDGKKIKELRLKKRWTQQTLAHEAKISITQVNRVERNVNTARFSTVERLAEALGVDPDELIEFTLLSA